MGTQPSLRIGDRERDATAAELGEHFAHGRLTLEEFNERIDAVFAAKTQNELDRITADLPHIRSGGAPLPSSRSGVTARPGNRLPASGWSSHGGALATQAGSAPVTAGWSGPAWQGPGSGDPAWSGPNWSGHGRTGGRPRGGFAAMSTLIAAIASWLLVFHVFLVGAHWPGIGRFGLLIAVFSVIRGLLRRIFRGSTRSRR